MASTSAADSAAAAAAAAATAVAGLAVAVQKLASLGVTCVRSECGASVERAWRASRSAGRA